MTKEQQKLASDNINLAYFTVNKYGLYKDDEEIAVALEELTIAAKNFDESRGCTFATYATKCIVHKIHEYNERYRTVLVYKDEGKWHSADSVSMNDVVTDSNHDEECCERQDLLTDNEDVENQIIERLNVQLFISRLHEREKKILYMRAAGKGQAYIAQQLGITQSHISRLIQKMRKAYERA